MNSFNFTPPEIRAVLFLIILLLIGSGITLYQRFQPRENTTIEFKEKNFPQQSISSGESPKTDTSKTNQTEKRITKINLNTATAQELETLPQIGPSLAQRIISYREKIGGFKSLDELKNVKGVKEKTYQKIRDYLTL